MQVFNEIATLSNLNKYKLNKALIHKERNIESYLIDDIKIYNIITSRIKIYENNLNEIIIDALVSNCFN